MTKAVQRRRGTNTQHSSFTGLEGELSVNTTNDSVHVHDGSTAGGFELARADMSNVSINDTDDFSDASATTIASSESIKAYVDAQQDTVDTLAEVMALGNSSGSTDLVITAGQAITTNTINETTAASGVTIDSVLLKDNGVTASTGGFTSLNSTRLTGGIQALGSISGANAIDVSAGDTVTATITGATSFTVSNLVSGKANTITMYLTNAGAGAITWPSGTVFNLSGSPTLPASGTTVIILETYDDGTSYAGIQAWRSGD